MTCKILINAIDPEECRIAKIKDNKLEDFHIETASREITQGNIYRGVITRIEPGLQSVFVDYGAERHGFLQKNEIHCDYYIDGKGAESSINQIVKKGQELIVQVEKDPILNKGAMLTTFISLPGRFLVLMPGSANVGISRKIEDGEERTRLKNLIEGLSVPEGFGVIIRTAGGDCTKQIINKDLKYLLRLWENIKNKGMDAEAPSLLYKERNLALRSIRDYFTLDVSGIFIDDEAIHNEIIEFLRIISPRHIKIVKFHQEQEPLFAKYHIENQIASIFESRVELKSGGSIVIERTEAMVTIDVNSGKATHKKSLEETAFLTNMQAAEEIARQLRLRDLGGLIVIDFIDMKNVKHRSEVEKNLKIHIKKDKARTKVGRISQFGVLEMSRQRIRPSIEFGSYLKCRYCNGKGHIPSTETLALAFLRKLQLETLKDGIIHVKGVVPLEVADYLLNRKRMELLELEVKRNICIRIEGNHCMIPGESEIICQTKTS